MPVSLPARYEDLDEAFRGRLIPNRDLISQIDRAYRSMTISGGIRFLPIYGESGVGKSCATRELGTHMPDVCAFVLSRDEIEGSPALLQRVRKERQHTDKRLLVAIVDQYEENVEGKERIPTQFVEHLSLLDRAELAGELIVFIWLTTSSEFQQQLVRATTRNRRLLANENFEVLGPAKEEWPQIVEETFSFHNSETPLADFGVIEDDIRQIARGADTLGRTILSVGDSLAEHIEPLQNLSEYQVILLWPVADSTRSQRVAQFTRARAGYRLNWDAWHTELNDDDRRTLPLREFNRARLYFDFRLIPIRAADLHKLCLDLGNDDRQLAAANLERFRNTHFFHLVSGNWNSYDYAPMRERESQRADDAKAWYETVTTSPTLIGKRLAKILRALNLDAEHEVPIRTEYGSVRADVFVEPTQAGEKRRIIELKVFASENTMPSSIKDQVKITLRRHAQLAGFLQRQ
ncbi:ATP-binding protein [Pistricoccus aurantiacus]|uniref:ATP-binding protein n=1 Tax=Pistricoccus aurantiacus TaxID=1883414 RepID=A0A5B8SLG3_9GAMM|nr:ATP-binding protein [Pistricoccus aurantiacus]QEA37952.1 ATP-binding protein [Pistricoccus aurantiacus]